MKYKYLCTILLLGFTSATTLAQPIIKAQRTAGGPGDDYFQCMDTTRDGGFIMGGYSNSGISGQKTDTCRGNNDFWILKYDSLGSIEWDKTIGGSLDDRCTAIQQTSDGGYIAGGWSASNPSGEKTEDTRGGNDYWLVKLDANGTVQWNKTIGGSSDDELYAIKQTTDGGYIAGGYSLSGKSGEKSEGIRGLFPYGDYWLVKLDATGAIQWDKTVGGDKTDILTDLQLTSDGGYIVGGYSDSDSSFEKTESSYVQCFGFPPRCSTTEDYWVVKLDANGNIQWDKTLGGDAYDELSALRQTADGGYILGGSSNSDKTGDKSENSRTVFTYGVNDYWVVKLDSTGNKQWDKTLGGYLYDVLQSLQQTRDGGYILAGYSLSDSAYEKTENNRGSYDYWVVKINTKGKEEWDKTIGGNNFDAAKSIFEVRKNIFIVGGYSHSPKSGDKTSGIRAKNDYWFVKLIYNKATDTTMGVTKDLQYVQIAKPNNTFAVYPNPAKEVLHIRNNGEATFTLTNQSGKILLVQKIYNSGSIKVTRLSWGVYFLKNNSTGITQKIVGAE